ncbi:MAG: phosphomannomutase/phosphoglucomutase [Planctomycetota bacterium]
MSIFKAYDVRGVYPEELDEALARRIGVAFATHLRARRVVVGRDMRGSSPSIQAALVDGLTAQGADVIDIGLSSTPMVYFAIGHLGVDGGVAVTASHNPAEYNGFKLSREQAIPMSQETGIGEIAGLVEKGGGPDAGRRGKVSSADIRSAYRDHIRRFASAWRPLEVVVDTANGMGGLEVPLILDGSPLHVTWLYKELDGTFPNHEANPLKDENLEDLARTVVKKGAHVGFAFDGDSDRCAFVDEAGRRVPSDIVTALIARQVLPQERGGAIVYDLRSSRMLPEEIVKSGGRPVRERVGHSFMKATLRREQGPFGGELSGHFYFRDNYYADSSLLAMVHMLNIMSTEARPLSEIVAPLRRYPSTGEVNFQVADKDGKIRDLAAVFEDAEIDYLDGITVQYADWWFNVRKSNTEPLLRLMLEAKEKGLLEEKRRLLYDLLGKPV